MEAYDRDLMRSTETATHGFAGFNLSIEEFFANVLPKEGLRCIATFAGGRHRSMQHHFYPNNEGAAQRARELDSERRTVFFGCSSYKSATNRKADNVHTVRSLWLDIDAGKEKPYPTAEAAERAVEEQFARLRLPPPWIVRSGHGIHVYLTFTKDVPPNKWDRLARKFRLVTEHAGLLAGPARTCDKASLLRPPGTHNRKGVPTLVRLSRRGKAANPKDIEAILDGYIDEHELTLVGAGVSDGTVACDANVNADLSGGMRPFDELDDEGKNAVLESIANHPAAKQLADLPLMGKPGEPCYLMLAAAFARSGAPRAGEILLKLSRSSPRFEKGGEAGFWRRYYDLQKNRREHREYGPGSLFKYMEANGWVPAWKQTGQSVLAASHSTGTSETSTVGPEAPNSPLERLNRKYGVVRIGSDVRVVDTETGDLLKVEAFKTYYNHQKLPNGKPLGSAWLGWEERRTFSAYKFAPGQQTPPGILNAYRGFGVTPQPGDITPWLIAQRGVIPDPDVSRYHVDWLAWKVQNPGAVPDTLMVIYGPKGAGKDALHEPVVQIFKPHAIVLSDPKHLTSNFNAHLEDKLFAVLDEAAFPGDPRIVNKLKAIVTAKDTSFERKGFDVAAGRNYCAFVITTNDPHAWYTTKDERRCVAVEASDRLCHRQNDFWVWYYAWLERGGAAHLLHYLINRDISGFNPRNIPKSAALRAQLQQTVQRDPVDTWWATVLTSECFTHNGFETDLVDGVPVPIADVRSSYEEHARGYRNAQPWNLAMRRLRQLVSPGTITTTRPNGRRMLVFPPIADMRSAFRRHTGLDPKEIA